MIFEIAIAPTIVSAIISGMVASVIANRTIAAQQERLRAEFQLEFSTDSAIKSLLSDGTYTMRSFDKIRHHLSGFEDNDLRRHLIRAGAIRFEDQGGKELWGLLAKHKGQAFK